MHQGQGEKNKHLEDKKRLTPLEDDRETERRRSAGLGTGLLV